jgi:hypothetical protein
MSFTVSEKKKNTRIKDLSSTPFHLSPALWRRLSSLAVSRIVDIEARVRCILYYQNSNEITAP